MATHHLFDKNTLILIALSGGKDSVVLTHLLLQLEQPVALMHCNFQLRGLESERDESFVRQWAAALKLPLHTRRFDTNSYADIHRCSIQVAARELRYAYFEEIRQSLTGPGKTVRIATAHHAGDSAETLLMHLFRGTGIEGLRGIPAINGSIIRPLLWAAPREIEEYALENQLDWVEDSSNLKTHYTRNFIRHKVLPLIEEQFPQALTGINATAHKTAEATLLYQEMVTLRLKKGVKIEKGIEKIAIAQWKKMIPLRTLLWEWVKKFGFTEGQVGEVEKLFDAANGSYIASQTHRLLHNRGWLLMLPVQSTDHPVQMIASLPAECKLPNKGMLKISAGEPLAENIIPSALTPQDAWLDAGRLRLPLLLRPAKPGDYFYPLGMQKKKKVARLLIDLKLSMEEKEQVWVLESDQRIVWVVGYRMDDRFKITAGTQQVVKCGLRFTKAK